MLYIRRSLGFEERGFTLIELLIVVLIIAILAAIAVPNFLEFQTRAKVSRVRADMRTLSVAIEAYVMDNSEYPPVADGLFDVLESRMIPLTTPIAYLATIPVDPFVRRLDSPAHGRGSSTDLQGNQYLYNSGTANFGSGINDPNAQQRFGWSLTSGGPDRQIDFPYWPFSDTFLNSGSWIHFIYDPTNGSVSKGEIFLRGGRVERAIPIIDVR